MPPLPLDPQRVVFEVLENIPVDQALIRGVANLHRRGYRVALDDYHFEVRWQPLLRFASIIKVDVKGLDLAVLEARRPALRRRRVLLLAEKVETHDEHARLSGRRTADEAYTVGLLSVLDAMFDRPLREILAELPLPLSIHEAITTFAGPDGCLLQHAIDLERGRPIVGNCAQLGGIDLVEVYLASTAAAFALLGGA